MNQSSTQTTMDGERRKSFSFRHWTDLTMMMKACTGIPATSVCREWHRRSSSYIIKQRCFFSFSTRRSSNFPFFKTSSSAHDDAAAITCSTPTGKTMIRWQSTISSSSSPAGGSFSDAAATAATNDSDPEKRNKNKRVTLAVYRQLLRASSPSRDNSPYADVPLSSIIPPIRLEAPEYIDATRLQALAQIIQATTGGTYNNSDTVVQQHIRSMLPAQTEIQPTHLLVPIHCLADIAQLVKAIFRINSETSTATQHYDKKRMSAAFTAVRSLNELMTSELPEIQQSRLDHFNRADVRFHIGQVVRHREDRWRGVIADWCHKHSNLNNSSSNNNNTAASPQRGKTSLTTKSYKRVRLESFPSPVEDGNEKDDSMNSETSSNIEYSVILHSGDASNLGSDERVMARVSQSELELVEDENLLRIRSPVVDELFTRFNASAGAFSPNDLLAYKYPCDDTVLLESKQRHNDNDDMLLEPSVQKLCDDIVAAVQDFAARRLLKHLRLQDHTLSMDTNPLLFTVNDRLVALANGKISVLSYHNRQADSGASPTSRQRVITSLPTATRKAAVLLLNELLRLQQHIHEINAMRQQCKEQGHRIQYCLGEIVKHKVFGFRGIVAGWDATPTVDVRNWDGLQHIENPMALPFYYIVPDINDCVQAFNGPRPLRYVCQENLEACPENQKFIQVDEKMLGPHEWHRIATVRSRATSADTTDTSSSKASYMAPFEVRYNFGEDLQDDGLTQDCLSQIEFEFNRWHVLARNGEIKGGDNNENTDEDLSKLENEEDMAVLAKLSIQNLQSLLRLVDNQKDAVMLQDLLKEMRRAHVNPRARQEMEKGMEELTSGQAKRASETFRRLVTDIDPSYAEAWNKLATCEFLMARYKAAMQASSQALELDSDNVPAITGLGLIHMELKEYEKAAYHFEKTMAIDPWSPVSFKLALSLDIINGFVVDADP